MTILIDGRHGVGDSAQPDANVKRLEDELEQSLMKNSNLDPVLPVRPAYGTQGRPITLWSNFMQLTSSGNLLLHRYRIEFSNNQVNGQPVKPKLRKRLIQLLLQAHFAQAGPNIVSDFKGTLIATKQLNVRPDGYRIVYLADDEDTARPNAPRYRIDLIPDVTLTVADLLSQLTSSNAAAMMNIIIGHNPKAATDIVSLGANRHHDWNACPS